LLIICFAEAIYADLALMTNVLTSTGDTDATDIASLTPVPHSMLSSGRYLLKY